MAILKLVTGRSRAMWDVISLKLETGRSRVMWNVISTTAWCHFWVSISCPAHPLTRGLASAQTHHAHSSLALWLTAQSVSWGMRQPATGKPSVWAGMQLGSKLHKRKKIILPEGWTMLLLPIQGSSPAPFIERCMSCFPVLFKTVYNINICIKIQEHQKQQQNTHNTDIDLAGWQLSFPCF